MAAAMPGRFLQAQRCGDRSEPSRPRRRSAAALAAAAGAAALLLAAPLQLLGSAWAAATAERCQAIQASAVPCAGRHMLHRRRSQVAMQATKAADAYSSLWERGVVDTAVQVLPFLAEDERSEFERLLEEKKPVAEAEEGTTDPELGDTAKTLYKKLRRLQKDEDVIAFRAKLDVPIRQAVQEIIEAEQAKTADTLAALSYTDEAEAKKAWKLFGAQFSKAAENGKYMTTPTREVDIKYRWRRMKAALGIDSKTALDITAKDPSPLFVDPDFIRRAWECMCKGLSGGRDEALRELVLRHPGSLIADAAYLGEKLDQAKLTAMAIDTSRGLFSWARTNVFGGNGEEK